MSQQYILQSDISSDIQEVGVIEKNASGGNDLLSGSYPIKVIVYKADTPVPVLTTGISNNYTVELHIGEREKNWSGNIRVLISMYNYEQKIFVFLVIRSS